MLVVPGKHLSEAEEGMPGKNAYIENDNIYSAVMGEPVTENGVVDVKRNGSRVEVPAVGQVVYCIVSRTSPTKAFCDCMAASELEGTGKRGIQIDAVLPVVAISRGYVREIGDAVKIGDIIKAKISKIDKKFYDITIVEDGLGVVKAFCSRCRSEMGLKDNIFTCKSCGWKEKRKLSEGINDFGRSERYGNRPERRGRYEGKRFGERKGFSRDRATRL